MPRHSCREVHVMQLHDILLLRTSAVYTPFRSAQNHCPTGQCAPCRRLYQMYAVKVYEAYITTRLKEKRIIMNKKYLPGELALCIVLIINSLGVCLMAKSGFGISTISSVPFVFNKVFPSLSFGTWNYIFPDIAGAKSYDP